MLPAVSRVVQQGLETTVGHCIIEPAHAKTRLSDTCLKLRKTDSKFLIDFASREVRSL